MLLFFSILCFILVLIVLTIFAELRLTINNLEIKYCNYQFNNKYDAKIGLYLFGKIKIISKQIQYNKNAKLLENKNIDHKIIKEILNNFRKKTKLEKFKLQIYLDTESVILTSYLIGIISGIIPNLIRENIKKYNHKYYNFEIAPLYRNNNFLYLKLSSIFTIKVVHIISMFRIIGGIKNERSSN